MSEQNRYRTARNYKSRKTGEWTGWIDKFFGETADTWQDAIQKWIDRYWPTEEYTVVSETYSEDSKTGITEIQFDPQQRFWLGVKIKATLIED